MKRYRIYIRVDVAVGGGPDASVGPKIAEYCATFAGAYQILTRDIITKADLGEKFLVKHPRVSWRPEETSTGKGGK